MTTQRRKFTIEGELQHSPGLTTEFLAENLPRAISSRSVFVGMGSSFITINSTEVHIDAVPTENTMKEKPFDPKKPFQTRDGRKARLLADDLKCRTFETLVVAVTNDDSELVLNFFRGGRHCATQEQSVDLINIPEKYVRWVNFYEGSNSSTMYSTKDQADRYCTPELNRIACVRVEFSEGEGL